MQSLKATPAPVDEPWSGPTSGPRAAAGKVVAVLAEDLRNGGVLGVAMGMREAAGEIGWRLKIFNAGGTRSGRVSAWRDGMASGADALAVCGSDAEEFEAFYRREAQPRTMIIGWHVAAAPGPLPGMAIRLNVTTDPQAVARVAAAAVLPAPGRRTGVVIFNDSRFSIANTKVAAMREVVGGDRNCTLLEVLDIPISESASRVPPAVEDLLRRYGPRWTHALAINDIYFDHAVQVLARVANPNYAPVLISAGDGSAAALLRIRSGAFQQGTVAEPLNMQGWQMVDELNRLFAGVPLSGFVPPVRLLTRESLLNLPDGASVYDPNNGYRGIYRALWKQGRYP